MPTMKSSASMNARGRKTLTRSLSPFAFWSALSAKGTRVLPARNELHIARKLWHMSTGLTIVALYIAGVSQSTGIQILAAITAFTLSLEVLRLKNPQLNEKCIRFFGPIIRSNEVNKISGVPYYAASSLIAVAVFPKPVAILSILYLAIGDPFSSLVGILCAKRSVKIFGGKSLHGTVGGFIACSAITWAYLSSQGMVGLDLIRITLLGGFSGALAEALPLELDDNFSIPIISGFMLWLGFIAIQFI